MAHRLLFIGLALVLSLSLTSSYVIDETFFDDQAVEAASEKTDDMTGRNDEGLQNQEDVPDSVQNIIKANLDRCSNDAQVKADKELLEKGLKLLESLRPKYQSFIHSTFVEEKELKAALQSENCAQCLLDKICETPPADLNVPSGLSSKATARICKRRLIKLFNREVKPDASNDCDAHASFRTTDGTCNNLQFSSFGAALTSFRRLLDADYADCVSKPRVAKNDKPLPNARLVSSTVHGSNVDRTNPDSKKVSHVAMTWGQFLDHDITLALAQGQNCEEPTLNPECVNIKIPEGDAIFPAKDVHFIELERDAPAQLHDACSLQQRQHVNQLTAFVDMSQVYGSNQELTDDVRGGGGGLRDMKHPHGCPLKNLLPALPEEEFCVSKDPNRPCFLAGDERTNENQALMSFHTLFLREHNRVSKELITLNPSWSDERIFQETRRILGAEMQIITYGEWLPEILGQKTRSFFHLELLEGKEYFKGYNEKTDPSISAAFASAAFRFGHDLVQEEFMRLTQSGFEHKDCDKEKMHIPIPVKDFGNPIYLYEKCQGGIDAIWRGLVKEAAAKRDGRASSSVQENLFRGPGDCSDLIAINIQRGRERGIPGYTAYRAFCKITPEVSSFDDLEGAGFKSEDVANLKKVYKNVDDIDLWTGGVLEGVSDLTKGGILGPTFQCILGEQFGRLRKGDRFWHENEPNAAKKTTKTAFTKCQLKELRKVSLAGVIVANSDDIPVIQRNVFTLTKDLVSCDKLPKISLEPWASNFECGDDDEPSAHVRDEPSAHAAHAEF